ncbi:MAG: hypothetical protein KH117_08375 [Dysgonomonas sp.]|uniref:hypothetical protein n=1 Tax=Dysgonomonas sp. TaxID=1891233 RepID=UPI00257D06D1|nr:hypothetical protein [Dysgonomonas sp.]MBS7121003.1 hypothetical protein [Dysgonomonas sp.]
MKTIYKSLLILFSGILLFSACSPDDPKLDTPIAKDKLSFEAYQDSENPNKVIIKSNNTSDIVYWSWDNTSGSAGGYTTNYSDTLKFGFAGKYTINYSIASNGGLVAADPKVIDITTYDLDYMEKSVLWTYLTGGVGKEKTWYLDLDARGKSVYFDGPMFFYGTDDSWESVTEGKTVGGDSWNWSPKYSENTWLMSAVDYGSLTFGAITGHTLVTDKKAESKTENGSYWMDVDKHTLTTTNATILRDSGRIAIVTKWTSMKILSLTENSMQLAVLRDNDPSEGPCLLVYNYVSKAYYDSHK